MKKTQKLLSWFIVFAICIAMFVGTSISVCASDVAETPEECCDAIFQVCVYYEEPGSTPLWIGYGSGFLINENYLLTAAHVVWDDSYYSYANANGDLIKDYLHYYITLRSDVRIEVYIVNMSNSNDMDFAIMQLDQPITNHKILELSNESPAVTSNVFALGFPSLTEEGRDFSQFTTKDVTVSSGAVNSISTDNGFYKVLHSANITGGNSGGPLIDEQGAVIGINTHYWTNYASTDFYASAITEIIPILNDLSIPYVLKGTEDTSETVDNAPTEALTEEVVDVAPQAETVEAQYDIVTPDIVNKEEKSGLSPVILIVIIVSALLLIGVIVLVVVLAAGKKKKTTAASAQRVPAGVAASPVAPSAAHPTAPVAPPVAPFATAPAVSGAGETTVLSGAGETTLLNAGAGETSVLSMAPLCKLIHEKNNETISISKPDFSIGKERARVDYCISDNNSVSRLHARIVCKEGKFFIIDQNATNGTYVNNVRSQPRREVEIKDGDQIKLSDEIFTFKVER